MPTGTKPSPGVRYLDSQKIKPYAVIKPADQEYVDKVERLVEEQISYTHENGEYPSVENKLPNHRCPSYHPPLYNPEKVGKACVCCGQQKTKNAFIMAEYREDRRGDICSPCMDRYISIIAPPKARKLVADKKVQAKKDEYAKLQAQNKVQEAVLRELAQRKLSSQRLLPFIMRFHEKYEPGWVHRAICKRLERFSEDVANRKSPRLMIFMPPRSGKSEIASKNFPAWHLGKYPDHEIIASSYAVSLPLGFSRKVRELIQSESYRKVFHNTFLSKTAQAAESWLTTKGGGYVAAGVGTGITGKGAHIAIIDDPVKDAEEADSETQRQKVWDWYSSTLYTRLAPGGGILCIQCMTGDTPVLMADGTHTRLDEIRPGDEVATFEEGKLTSARVLNWANQGPDSVYRITTTSGKVVRANERHPFLVQTRDGLVWTRLRDLKSGQRIVVVKDSKASGEERLVQSTGATSPLRAKASACSTITKRAGLLGIARRFHGKIRRLASRLSSSIVTALLLMSTRIYWPSREDAALFVRPGQNTQATRLTGQTSYASITTTTPELFVDSSATTATSFSNAETQLKFLSPLYDTDDFTTEEIIAIEPAGWAEVFDIQVERTENFIANVIVTHNTRWHDDDLSGRLIRRQREREKQITEEMEQLKEELEAASDENRAAIEADLERLKVEYEHMERWDILVFPQEATFDEYYSPAEDQFYDQPAPGLVKIRDKGEPLHPERFDKRAIIRMKQTMEPRHWSALHQQNPVPEEGEIFTKSMFRYEPVVHDWRFSDVYIAGDLALGVKQSNDWSVLLAGAMDYDGLLHIIDMSRFKGGAVPIEENLIALLKRYERRLALFGLEQGQIQMALWPALLKRIKDEKLAVPFAEGKRALKPVSDKVARARTAQSMMQQGRIIFPDNQPWVEDVKIELLRFPGGLHDDIVDALAWLARMTVKAEPPKRAKPKGFKSWKEKLSGYTRDGKGHGHLSA